MIFVLYQEQVRARGGGRKRREILTRIYIRAINRKIILGIRESLKENAFSCSNPKNL